jgi:thymidylate synthase ThyX/5-methylcytosine-specific restriction endonuclease McrA
MLYRAPVVTVIARPSFTEPPHLPVHWLGDSTDGERLAEFAGRLCYMSQSNPAERTTSAYLENIKRQGHGSVLEHANYSLLYEGVSRALTHELVRHRAGFAYCLAEGTLVYSEHWSAGKRDGVRKRPIEQLYAMSLTPHGRSRLKLVRLRCLDEMTGTFTTGRIAAIAASGLKPVFRVELEDGKTIECTKEHRFLTPSGWKSLHDAVGGLTVSPGGVACVGRENAELMVNGVAAYRDREWLRIQYQERNLDHAAISDLAGVSKHTIRAWIRRHRLQKPIGSWTIGRAVRAAVYERDGHTCRLCAVRGGRLTLHHILPIWAREDLALDLDNLATVCRACHLTMNGHELDYVVRLGRRLDEIPAAAVPPRQRSAGNLMVPRRRRITRVTYVGERETYDIEMAGPHHNFVANGIVTHNSQLSQRYVDESQANFVVPPAILGDDALEAQWREQAEAAQAAYVALVSELMARYTWVPDRVHRRKMAREAARGVLPNSTETKIVVTANARAWRTMLALRAGEGADLEIRRLAVATIRLLQHEAPAFFSDFEIYVADDRREAARSNFHKV